MLDGLETDDDVDTAVREGNFGTVPLQEVQARVAVAALRVGDGLRREIDAMDERRRLREQRTAIAFAAGDVEHDAASDELRGHPVSMQMLDRDLSRHFGQIALAGPRQRGRRVTGHFAVTGRAERVRVGSFVHRWATMAIPAG